jgi:hypothetical protein
MGQAEGQNVNDYYLLIFCEIILKCVTPGMLKAKDYSPYFSNQKINQENDSEINFDICNYPKLPDNWTILLSTQFFLINVLLNYNSMPKEIICHLCYCDDNVSIKILTLLNEYLRFKNVMIQVKEKIFKNALNVFELKDNLQIIRAETLFQLNFSVKDDDLEQKGLFEFFFEERENSIALVLDILYAISESFDKYETIYNYFEKNKIKIKWIKEYIKQIKTDEKLKDKFNRNCSFVLAVHKDLLDKIEESFCNKLLNDIE